MEAAATTTSSKTDAAADAGHKQYSTAHIHVMRDTMARLPGRACAVLLALKPYITSHHSTSHHSTAHIHAMTATLVRLSGRASCVLLALGTALCQLLLLQDLWVFP